MLDAETLKNYLPKNNQRTLPVLYEDATGGENDFTEREILYKVLFDMKKDIGELKKLTHKLMKGDDPFVEDTNKPLNKTYDDFEEPQNPALLLANRSNSVSENQVIQAQEVISPESLSLQDKEIEMIKNALEKHRGKRKGAATELGISERTLYRKIKQYDL